MTAYRRKRKKRRGNLTNRQIEILILISQGLSTKQIATKLDRSYYTIRNHTSRMYRKFDAENRAQFIYKIMSLIIR
jgi:DNA-binding NarL/FixJ family response regulator